MTRILCIANQKGGVGKTTTAINVSAGLARAGCRTMLIDLDPQGNATTGVGQKLADQHPVLSMAPLSDVALALGEDPWFLVPGSRSFRDADSLAQSDDGQTARLIHRIAHGTAQLDYVLFDCPPSLGPLTQAALCASTEVLMPIQAEYFAMEGLTQMLDMIRAIMRRPETRLEFGGILLTMYDHTLELTQEVDHEVREYFGPMVFETVIPRDVAVSEAPSYGLSVLDYAPRSRGSRAYTELCMEVLERV